MKRWTPLAPLALSTACSFFLAAACSSSSPDMWNGPPLGNPAAAASGSTSAPDDAGPKEDATSSRTDAGRASAPDPTGTATGEAGKAAEVTEASVALSEAGEGGGPDGATDAQTLDGGPTDGGAVCAVDNIKYLGELLTAGPEPEPCTSGCPASDCCYLGVACLPE